MKVQGRAKIRRERYERLFGGRELLAAGLLAIPGLVFNPSALLRTAQFFIFWFYSFMAGKKNNPFPAVLAFLGIASFSLLVPYGRILFSLGNFPVTQGALLAGLRRAATLEGLIMLSRAAIRPDLSMTSRSSPGSLRSLGNLLEETFQIFARLQERKGRIRLKTFFADTDALMLELSGEEGERPGQSEKPPPPLFPGLTILLAAVILAWLPWLFLLIKPIP